MINKYVIKHVSYSKQTKMEYMYELLSVSRIIYSLPSRDNHVKEEAIIAPLPPLTSLLIPQDQSIYCNTLLHKMYIQI